jgi:hypothetical protein
MRAFILTVIAGLAVASAASAQRIGPNDKATVCLDPGGVSHPPLCRSQNASRFPTQPDICSCHGPWRQVDAPWCAPGERPAPDTAALATARIAFAEKNNNSLIGFTFEGKRNCIVPGHNGLP